MKKLAVLAVLAVATALVSIPQVASAQNFSSYVASNGVDGNPCTRAQPCRTLQHAHETTNASGIITVVDPGDYGNVTINKSISIVASAFPTGVGTAGGLYFPDIVINAGPTDVVLLRGLDLAGANASAGFGAIAFNTGAKLLIHDCIVNNWNVTSGNAAILFTPTAASVLIVTDSIISNNTNGSSGAGILVRPSGSGSARVNIERTVVEGNAFGIAADGTGSSGGINMTIADSVSSSNINDGIIATTPSGGAPIGITVTNTRSTNNGFGLRSLGTNVTVRADRSTVIGNGTGLTAGSGGALLSAGTNVVEANGSNGAFSGPLSLK
jgi:hypothetical protein